MDVIIVGGSRTGSNLAKRLSGTVHDPVIIEKMRIEPTSWLRNLTRS